MPGETVLVLNTYMVTMKSTNEWISDGSVVWHDPTICSEEERLLELNRELRTFCVETCLILPEVLRDPFLEFLDYLDLEQWTYRDVFRFHRVVLSIIHILEPIHTQVNPRELDMASWYMIGAFSECWKSKVEDVRDLWRTNNKYLMN